MTYYDIHQLPQSEKNPGGRVSFVHTEHITMAYWNFDSGYILAEHSHPHEQVTNIISGEFEFTVGGETRRVGPGSVITIEPNVKHSGKSITASTIIDVFYPVREDFRASQP